MVLPDSTLRLADEGLTGPTGPTTFPLERRREPADSPRCHLRRRLGSRWDRLDRLDLRPETATISGR